MREREKGFEAKQVWQGAEEMCFHLLLKERAHPCFLQPVYIPTKRKRSALLWSHKSLLQISAPWWNKTTLRSLLESPQSRGSGEACGMQGIRLWCATWSHVPENIRVVLFWEAFSESVLCAWTSSEFSHSRSPADWTLCLLASVSEAQTCFSPLLWEVSHSNAKQLTVAWVSFTYLFLKVKMCPPTRRLVQRNKLLGDTLSHRPATGLHNLRP